MRRRMSTLSDDKDHSGPAKARSDLIDILSHDPKNTEVIVTIIQNELTDLKDEKAVTNALNEAAASSKVDAGTRDNVLYWLTETTPDVRQMILVQTIEELLEMPQCKDATITALIQISSEDNVKMVMEWVERKILTLNQAVYVLLYPDSSTALK
jgi:EAL domain-containing protein (putative c-di-GMP-specific phosphodiesterase class I)